MACMEKMLLFKISSRIYQACARRGVHGMVGINGSAISGNSNATPHSQRQAPSTWIQYSLSTDSGLKLQPPKRPLTAFFIFSLEKQPDLMLEQPDLPITQITKQTALLWKGLPESEKQKYTQLSSANMEKFKTDYRVFLNRLTDEQRAQIKKDRSDKRKKLALCRLKKKLKSLDKPKGLRSSYTFFIEEQMISRGTTPMLIYSKEVAARWKSLSDAVKQPYMDRYEEDKQRYATEMQIWEDRMKADGHPEYVRGYKAPKPPKARKRRRVVAKKKKAAPKKRAKKAKKGAKQTVAKKTTSTKKGSGQKEVTKKSSDRVERQTKHG